MFPSQEIRQVAQADEHHGTIYPLPRDLEDRNARAYRVASTLSLLKRREIRSAWHALDVLALERDRGAADLRLDVRLAVVSDALVALGCWAAKRLEPTDEIELEPCTLGPAVTASSTPLNRTRAHTTTIQPPRKARRTHVAV